ncbi:MAG: TRAP transporter large permease subunit, partial [Clostridia bacterium]|nr:TRAP transporter large permease subunit [Clostridia bacterium]
TGLGMKLSSLLIALSGGSLPVLLVLTMVASIILGMGLPTTACYVVLATLAAPALIELGVSPLAAHLFVFFFGMIAPITPPVALAAYVGAGIAQGDPVKTGFIAFRLGLASFLIPFVFVYSPALLMHGEVGQILWTAFTTLMGVYALASGLEGFGFLPLNYPLRILLIAAAVMLIIPEVFTDILGLVLVVATMLGQLYYRRQRQVSAQHSS